MFVNKLLINSFRVIRTCNVKSFCTATKSALRVEHLKSRSVLKVSGDETSVFMQGLVTNDMRHLEEGACSMYTMFLNTKGRVMYDAIIYKTPEEQTFLVECDTAAVEPLKKHLNMFRIRRKVVIESLANTVDVWAIFNPTSVNITKNPNDDKSRVGSIVPCSTLEESQVLEDIIEFPLNFASQHSLTACRDPRLAALGIRIIAPKSKDVVKIAGEEMCATPLTDKNHSYKTLRYRLGVGEGLEDLPLGKCFPLEANCDYLHGVSFHKGCYIGQELTARTHHTGVVRKRLMPINFDTNPTVAFVPDAPIQHCDNSKSALGKLRGVENTAGLALLRIVEALDAPALKVFDVTARTAKPKWWPQEAPKDRLAAGKDVSSN